LPSVVFVIAVELHALLVLVELVVAVVVGVEAVVALMQEEAVVLVLVLLLLVVHLDCLAQMIGHVQCKRLRLKCFCFIDSNLHFFTFICMHHIIAAP
jgi:hypothetical protein